MRQVFHKPGKAPGPGVRISQSAGRETLRAGAGSDVMPQTRRSATLDGPPGRATPADLPLVLTRQPRWLKSGQPGARGRVGGAPALPPPLRLLQREKRSSRSMVPRMSASVVRGLIVHSRATVRPSSTVVLGAA